MEAITSALTHVIPCVLAILYTALNSPSLIFALYRSKTDSPSLEFAQSQIFLHNHFQIVQLAQF